MKGKENQYYNGDHKMLPKIYTDLERLIQRMEIAIGQVDSMSESIIKISEDMTLAMNTLKEHGQDILDLEEEVPKRMHLVNNPVAGNLVGMNENGDSVDSGISPESIQQSIDSTKEGLQEQITHNADDITNIKQKNDEQDTKLEQHEQRITQNAQNIATNAQNIATHSQQLLQQNQTITEQGTSILNLQHANEEQDHTLAAQQLQITDLAGRMSNNESKDQEQDQNIDQITQNITNLQGDVEGKMDKVPTAVQGHIATFGENGQVVDGGNVPSGGDYMDKVPTAVNGHIATFENGQVVDGGEVPSGGDYMDKVPTAVQGHMATFGENGQVVDGGEVPSVDNCMDKVPTAVQGHIATFGENGQVVDGGEVPSGGDYMDKVPTATVGTMAIFGQNGQVVQGTKPIQYTNNRLYPTDVKKLVTSVVGSDDKIIADSLYIINLLNNFNEYESTGLSRFKTLYELITYESGSSYNSGINTQVEGKDFYAGIGLLGFLAGRPMNDNYRSYLATFIDSAHQQLYAATHLFLEAADDTTAKSTSQSHPFDLVYTVEE